MMPLGRRDFLAALARAGLGAAALASLPPAVREALAAGVPPDVLVRSDRPEQWETTLAALGRSWQTPNDAFFVRGHLGTPDLDPKTWKLEVTGAVRTPLTLSLAQLQALPRTEVPCTIECAGNGRGLMRLASTSGTQWGLGAVGTATWGGVRLSELLHRAELAADAQHVWFEAADMAPMPDVPRFVRSIPLAKAMFDTLLAWRMNGQPLPQLHGAPVRAVVPGWYGMASTKWLTRVRVEKTPSDNHFMVRGYRYNAPGQDPMAAAPVETMRVKSLITRPFEGDRVSAAGRGAGSPVVRVEGFAWAGPAGVRDVDVSGDGGRTWVPAVLTGRNDSGAWRSWTCDVPAAAGDLTLLARATDGAGDVQPLEARVNAGGYGNNAIQAVRVHVAAH
jgi:DMSO/TMAO reductase YedYZ molybdopterin-dependent catalytic subunit